ncbi:hypothetical protein ACU42Y_21070 [Proteus mirabilis]
MAREVFNKFKACINVPGVNGYRDMRDAINVLYKSLQADKEKADISDIMKDLYEIVDGSIDTTHKVKEPKPDGDQFTISARLILNGSARSFLNQSERILQCNRSSMRLRRS